MLSKISIHAVFINKVFEQCRISLNRMNHIFENRVKPVTFQ